MNERQKERCGHVSHGGDGVMRECDLAKGHQGWHRERVQLRDGPSTTNWGDDGLSIYASRDEARRRASRF